MINLKEYLLREEGESVPTNNAGSDNIKGMGKTPDDIAVPAKNKYRLKNLMFRRQPVKEIK